MKRIMTLCLVLAMALSMAACAGGNNSTNNGTSGGSNAAADSPTAAPQEASGQASSGEMVTYTLYEGDSNVTDTIQPKDTPIGKAIEELTNVRLDVQYLSGQNEEERAGIMVASGDYPDLIVTHNAFPVFRDAGAIIPMNDLIEKYGDNIKRLYGDKLKRLYDANGNIYSYTWFDVTKPIDYPASGFFMNYGALKENNYPVITDVDAYFDMIRKYVAAHPQVGDKKTIGFTGPAEGWRFVFSVMGGDKLNGMHNTGDYFYDPANNYQGTNRARLTQRRDYFKLLNGLNQEGLLDPEMLSQTYDQYVEKIAAGRVVGFYDETWEIQDARKALKQNKNYDAYPVAMPVDYPDVQSDSFMGLAVMGTSPAVCISVNAKDPEAIFKYLDRMGGDDILKLKRWGIEGQDYQVDDKGVMSKNAEQYTRDKEYLEKQGFLGLWSAFPTPWQAYAEFPDGSGFYNPDYAPEKLAIIYDDGEKEILSKFGWKTFMEPFGPMWESPYGYGWDINLPADNDELIDIKAQLDEIGVDTYYQKMILCKPEEFDGLWQELQDKLDAIGLDKLEANMTEQVRARIEAWK